MVDDRCDNLANWTEIELDVNCTFTVEAAWQGRSDVIKVFDNNAAGQIVEDQDFASGQTNGTIYLYFGLSDATDNVQIWFGSDEQDYRIGGIRSGTDDYFYYDGGWHKILDVADNTWYDCEIRFECGAGGHDGLAADTYNIYIDDVEYGAYDFRLGVDEIDYIRVRTNDGGLVDSGYIDSLYYSWDSVPPAITDVNTDEIIKYDQTGVIITGTTFETEGANSRVRINSQADGLGTDEIQTDTSWADTSIEFNVNKGALSYGTNYIFVRNDTSDENAAGFEITIQTPTIPQAFIREKPDKRVERNVRILRNKGGGFRRNVYT